MSRESRLYLNATKLFLSPEFQVLSRAELHKIFVHDLRWRVPTWPGKVADVHQTRSTKVCLTPVLTVTRPCTGLLLSSDDVTVTPQCIPISGAWGEVVNPTRVSLSGWCRLKWPALASCCARLHIDDSYRFSYEWQFSVWGKGAQAWT